MIVATDIEQSRCKEQGGDSKINRIDYPIADQKHLDNCLSYIRRYQPDNIKG